MVVEITPLGIEHLQWKFYIIWTVFNASFVPIVYFLYPETAGRTLEDLDRYFHDNKNILVFRDKEATASKRPQHLVEHEHEEIRRNSSVRPADVSEAARKHLAETLEKVDEPGDATSPDSPRYHPERFEKEEV